MLGGVVAPEAGSAFEMGDDREERAVFMEWRAEETQPNVRFAGNAISSPRPTSGVVDVRNASKRLATKPSRNATQVRAGPVMPLRFFAPRS